MTTYLIACFRHLAHYLRQSCSISSQHKKGGGDIPLFQRLHQEGGYGTAGAIIKGQRHHRPAVVNSRGMLFRDSGGLIAIFIIYRLTLIRLPVIRVIRGGSCGAAG